MQVFRVIPLKVPEFILFFAGITLGVTIIIKRKNPVFLNVKPGTRDKPVGAVRS